MVSKKRVQFNVLTTEDNNEKNVIISDFYVSDLTERTFTTLDVEEMEVIKNEFNRESNKLLEVLTNSNGDISCTLGETLVSILRNDNINEVSKINTINTIIELVRETLNNKEIL